MKNATGSRHSIARSVGVLLAATLAIVIVAATQRALAVELFPVTSISGVPAGWAAGDVMVTLTSDPASGVQTSYTLDDGPVRSYAGPFVVSGEGTTTIRYWSTDGHSAHEEPGVDLVRIDRTPPDCTISGLPGAWMLPGQTITPGIIGSDALSGIARVLYRVGDGPVLDALQTPPLFAASAGTWILYQAVDAAGNASPPRTAPVLVDTGAPVTVPVGLPARWSRDDVMVSLTAQSPRAAVDHTDYRIGGGPGAVYGTPLTIDTEGTTVVEFSSVDVEGHREQTRTASVLIDRSGPVSHAGGLPSGVTSSAVVALSATDTFSGVAALFYRYDGGPAALYDGPMWLREPAGLHALEWWAVDTAGNEEPHHTAVLEFDSVPPTTGCDAKSSYVGTATVNLAPSSDAIVTWYVLDSNGGAQPGTSVTVSAPGTHHVDYWSVDAAGNAETPRRATFTVTTQTVEPPVVVRLPTTTTLRVTRTVDGKAVTATSVKAGTYVTMRAQLRGGTFVGTYLRFEVGFPHGSYKLYKTVKVGLTGFATYRYKVKARGYRYHRVRFAGTAAYLPAPLQHGIRLRVR